MELFENRSDVSSLFCYGKNMCSCMHHTLKFREEGIWKYIEERLLPLSSHEEISAWIMFVAASSVRKDLTLPML